MDRLRIKRPGTQKPSQTAKNTSANSAPVVEANSKQSQSSNSNTPQTALLARRVPIDMELPGEGSPSRIEIFIQQTKWRRVRLVATRTTAVMVVLTMTLGGLLLSQNYLKLHKVFRGGAPTADALNPVAKADLLNGQSTGRVNVLLLGLDGAPSKNPDLTNTIMVASIDTVNDTVSLISVPSNLWVNVPNYGDMKINAAWQAGENKYMGTEGVSSGNDTKAIEAGYKVVDGSVQQILGLKINYNAEINMSAISQIVNTLGGISVNVPTTLTDPTMAWQNNNNPVIASTGTQTMNGKQALLYMMSKETTSDFDRDARQRLVLSAMFNKLVSTSTYSNPLTLDSLINTLGNNVSSDLSLGNAAKVYKLISNVSSSSVNSIDLASSSNQLFTSGNVNGMAVDLPQLGLFNYTAINKYISSQLRNPYFIKENAKIMVLNGTNVSGLATNMANNLRKFNLNVLGAANAPTSNWSNTTLIQINKQDKYTAAYLSKQLKVKVTNKLPNKSIPTDGADFVIIIGNNEAINSQT
jgi:LCP family protein required for cell wall assembly